MDSRAIAINRTDIDIGTPGSHADSSPALLEVRIDECPDIFIPVLTRDPEIVQLVKNAAGHFECAPDPFRAGIALLDLNFTHPISLRQHNGIEEFGMLDREKQKRKLIVRKLRERRFWKPDGIRKADNYWLVRRNQWCCAEYRITQSARLRLHNISEGGFAVAGAVIAENVGLAGRDHEANLVGATQNHTLDQVLANGAWSLG